MAELEPAEDIPLPQDGGVDEDFLYHLYRGGELLAAGKNLEARDELERAYHLKPQNQKAQNLLGLVYFKLGLLDRAIEVYDRLVLDNPGDATLRINLGLVFLKAGQTHEAIDQLEAAIAVVPDHPKALNYLGLAYAQAQAHDKAKAVFDRAGNLAMARKMEQAKLGEGSTEAGAIHLGHSAAAKAAISQPPLAVAPAGQSEPPGSPPAPHATGVGRRTSTPAALPMAGAAGSGTAAAPPAPNDPLPQPPSRFGRTTTAPLGLNELARFSVYDPPAALPFQVDSAGVTLKVEGEMRARLSGLLWVRGDLQRKPEQKRFRGRATDKPFGEGPDRMNHLTGHGQVVLAIQGQTFTPVELDDEAAYLVEDALFAFEETLGYENGRVPSKSPPDLQLVHLRGRGKALLRSQGPLRSVEVRPSEPLQLPIDRLLGWMGQLTPTLLVPDEMEGNHPNGLAGAAGRWLKLEGEGWALWAMPQSR